MIEPELFKRPDAKLYREVRRALRRWDPIGVLGEDSDCPRDEYDNYAPGIVRLFHEGTSVAQLAEALHEIATESMGLGSRTQKIPPGTLRIAHELLELWEKWKQESE